jgi:hypothetical protein
MDWPFKLNFGGNVYTLSARGFWDFSHYWLLLLKNLNGVVGVWRKDDQENKGNAQLTAKVPVKAGKSAAKVTSKNPNKKA